MPDQHDSPFADPDNPPGTSTTTETEIGDPSDQSTDQVTEPDPDRVTVDVDALQSGESGELSRLLAEEFRRDELSDEDRSLLRAELVTDERSLEEDIGRLQRRVGNFEAYISALTVFLDENGDGQERLNEFEETIQTLEDELATLESKIADQEDGVTDLQPAIAEVEDEIDGIEEQLNQTRNESDRHENTIDDLRTKVGRVDEVADRADAIEDDIDAINNHLEALDEFKDRLTTAIDQV